jgi:hypothetical protein
MDKIINVNKIGLVMVTNGVVRIWDSVAGHYTTCHSLTPRQVKRIVKAAK